MIKFKDKMKYAKLASIVAFLAVGIIYSATSFAATTIGSNITTNDLTLSGALKFTTNPAANYILSTDGNGNTVWISVDSAVDSRITAQKGEADGLAPLDSLAQVPMSNLLVGVPGGMATLGGDGKVPSSQLSSIMLANTHVVGSITERNALTNLTVGTIAIVTGENKTYVYAGNGDWQEILTPGSPVIAVNGQTGSVSLTTDNIDEGAANKYYSLSNIADGSISELKLDINNTPTDGYYLKWSDALGKMEWHQVASIDTLYLASGRAAADSNNSVASFQTSFLNKLTVSFTPAVTGDYVVNWSAEATNDTGSNEAIVRVQEDSTDIARGRYLASAAGTYSTLSGFSIRTLTASTAYTYTIDYASAVDGQTSHIRNTYMTIQKL